MGAKIPVSGTISIDYDSMDRLIRRADGSAALLYIYILRCNGKYDEDSAAADLNMDRAEIRRALSVLISDELNISVQTAPGAASSKQHLPSYETPQYSSADIKNKLAHDNGFALLLNEVQSMLGKLLSSEDTMKLYGIYDDLGFPSELILHLINYCIRDSQRRYGPGRKPTVRQIQRVAFEWEREGICTLSAAEEYIRLCEEFSIQTAAMSDALQIHGRALTSTEKEYISSWIRMGFKSDAAEIAYDRTVTRTGRLSWKYMDSIFKSWHSKGLHSPGEIEAGDGSPAQRTPPRGKNSAAERHGTTADDFERMRRYLDSDND